MGTNISSTSEYSPYPYQKRRQYERLKEAFPTASFIEMVKKKFEPEDLRNYREFQILVEVHKLSKTKRGALGYVNLYQNYVEEASPEELWKEKKVPEPKYFGFEVEALKPRIPYLPYWFKLSVDQSSRQVKVKKKRMIDYSRIYQLNLRLLRDHKKWLLDFFTAFFYCQPIHRLDLVKAEIRAETFDGKIKILVRDVLTKTPFRMPIWGRIGVEGVVREKLKEVFNHPHVLELLEDQLTQRYPFVWCLTLDGEPIPRRKKVKSDSAEEIAEFFQEENGVEWYRSADKRGIDKVDTIILEFDPPLRMENENSIWQQIVKDTEKFLQLLIEHGLNPKSVEINFSGNKSLQILIHIDPPVTYQATRDIQCFLASFFKFEVAEDSYMYTLDKTSGLARVTMTLADWTYGRKKEIKCVPVPNLKRAPIGGDICCSIRLELQIQNGKVKFAPWVFDLNMVRDFSRWENVREQLLKEEALSEKRQLYKPQSYYERNATNPEVFQKLMKDFYWYDKAMREILPCELDLWRKEWIRESFA